MTDTKLEAVLEKAEKIVLEAGELIRDNWNRPKNISKKGRIDLVTETDLAVEKFLKEKLSQLLPEATFLAEETAGDADLGDMTWIIDPLDGTTNFAHNLPMVATSVALWKDGEVVLGIINLPVMGEVFTAIKGAGAKMNGTSISTTETQEMEQSLIATGFPYAIEKHARNIADKLTRVLMNTRGVRRPGAAALDLAYLACGRYDGFYENELKPWDTAAGWLLVEEAGGRVTDFAGKVFNLYSPSILATNGRIHEKLSELVKDDKPSSEIQS